LVLALALVLALILVLALALAPRCRAEMHAWSSSRVCVRACAGGQGGKFKVQKNRHFRDCRRLLARALRLPLPARPNTKSCPPRRSRLAAGMNQPHIDPPRAGCTPTRRTKPPPPTLLGAALSPMLTLSVLADDVILSVIWTYFDFADDSAIALVSKAWYRRREQACAMLSMVDAVSGAVNRRAFLFQGLKSKGTEGCCYKVMFRGDGKMYAMRKAKVSLSLEGGFPWGGDGD
jgi:hypothetical protein